MTRGERERKEGSLTLYSLPFSPFVFCARETNMFERQHNVIRLLLCQPGATESSRVRVWAGREGGGGGREEVVGGCGEQNVTRYYTAKLTLGGDFRRYFAFSPPREGRERNRTDPELSEKDSFHFFCGLASSTGPGAPPPKKNTTHDGNVHQEKQCRMSIPPCSCPYHTDGCCTLLLFPSKTRARGVPSIYY